ncbi:MAG: gluconate 2-dehydrogenase subunit 3 family protein [Bryobacteraceae bacterium]|nr:gluconate 2-dehydrogenase subunit 3 family protein [Bryobacteraceae bacterium]
MSSRRHAIKTLAGATGLVTIAPAQQNSHQHADPPTTQAGDKPLIDSKKPRQAKFFTKDEFETVELLVDLIIPRTDTPGARDAGVHFLIDERVPLNESRRTMWREGLADLDATCTKLYEARFSKLKHAEQIELLTAMSKENNTNPRRFFELVKGATADAYYETREGLATELGWHGNVALTEFPGCTHPEHQV